jgi:acyl carrier protein
VQRNLCRERYLAGELRAVAGWVRGESTPRGAGGHAADNLASRSSNGSGKANGVAAVNGAASRNDADSSRAASGSGAAGAAKNGPHQPPPTVRPLAPPSVLPKISLPQRPLRPEEVDRLSEQIQTWIMDWLVERAGVQPAEIAPDRPFADFGLDSLTAVELSQELEDWLKIELTPVIAWNYPTLATLARHLAEHFDGGGQERASADRADATEDRARDADQTAVSDFERLLAEVETLSEDDATTALEDGIGNSRGRRE